MASKLVKVFYFFVASTLIALLSHVIFNNYYYYFYAWYHYFGNDYSCRPGDAFPRQIDFTDGGIYPRIDAHRQMIVNEGIAAAHHANAFLMFFGYPRSGHSLIGSLIDAHAQAAVSNEWNFLKWCVDLDLSTLQQGLTSDQTYQFQEYIFQGIIRNCVFCGDSRSQAGYDYHVPNGHQGEVAGITIVGDKKGGGTTAQIIRWTHEGLTVEEAVRHHFMPIRNALALPFRYIHVMRSPYDMAATQVLRNTKVTKKIRDKKTDQEVIHDDDMLTQKLSALLHEITVNFEIMRIMKADLENETIIDPIRVKDGWLDVYSEYFNAHAEDELKRVCDFLDLTCTPEYLQACLQIVHSKPHYSCLEIHWTAEACEATNAAVLKHPQLKEAYYDSRVCCK